MSLMKSKKYVVYAKKSFVQMKNHEKEFKKRHRVRDHCHCTEKFRGTAHNNCNL